MYKLTEFILEIWPYLSVIIPAGWAFITYIHQKKRELAWKRTEYIFDQSRYLDNDKEMVQCTLILYGRHPEYSVDSFLEAALKRSSDSRTLFMMFEKYLNFLWRICYARIVLKTLTKKDMEAFGAYFRAISKHPPLYKYCFEEGYDEINAVIDELGWTPDNR